MRDTREGDFVGISEQIPGTILYASSSVVICELRQKGSILSTFILALACEVIRPSIERTGVGAIIADGGSYRAWAHAGMCIVISKGVGQCGTSSNTIVC